MTQFLMDERAASVGCLECPTVFVPDQCADAAFALRCLPMGAVKSGRYFFILQGSDGLHDDDANGTVLSSDAAAQEYADRIVRELKADSGYNNSKLKMIVKNSDGRVISLIPF